MSKAARAGRARHKHATPTSVSVALSELAHHLGIAGRLEQYNILTSWGKIVGEQVARVTEPQRMDNGVLTVAVKTAPWRNELAMRKREIIGKINAAAGKHVVKDIRFR